MSYSQPHRPSGTLDFSVIGESFKLLFSRWQEYLLMGSISCLLPAVVMVIFLVILFSSAAFATPSSFSEAAMIGTMLLMYPMIFVAMLLTYPFYGGICSYTLKLVRTGDASMSDFWGEWSRAGKWIVLGLLISIWNLLGALACGIGSFVVAALLFMAMPIMAHEDLSPTDAIRESYERLKTQFWPALGMAVVASVVATLGMYACYVGMLLSLPLMYMIPAMAYAKWLSNIEQAPSAGPFPQPGQYGQIASPMQEDLGEVPRQQQGERAESDARRAAEEELKRDTGEQGDHLQPDSD